MDIFTNKIPKDKFSSTNELWNRLGLNKAWSVGYTTTLIKQKKFKNKEEWYSYYFESGEKRLAEISKLNDYELGLINGKTQSSNKFLNKLNYNYGRTKLEIAQKGVILYNEVLKEGNPYNLTEDDCKYIAYYRVVCETWNGIMGREFATKKNIINQFDKKGYEILIIDTTGQFDYEYGVDFELYYDGRIICGIQIKPESYSKGDADYLQKAKEINEEKNNKYKSKFNRNVHYIYSNHTGYIINNAVIDVMLNELKTINKSIA